MDIILYPSILCYYCLKYFYRLIIMHSTQFLFEATTLGLSDDSVITSIAITPFTFQRKYTLKELKESTLYIKLNQLEQVEYGRSIDTKTIDWWEKQSNKIRESSYISHDSDISCLDALKQIKDFLTKHGYDYKESFIWGRNYYLFSSKLLSLVNMFYDQPYLINNYNWHEAKTLNYILTNGETQKYKLNDKIDDKKYIANIDSTIEAYRLIEVYFNYFSDGSKE